MSLPAPRPGLVIRYSFLWSNEKDAGAQEGAKDRPCAIVLAARRMEGGDIRTLVAPVTHSPPGDRADSVELPSRVCRALGLDEAPHWVRLDELNLFSWPGFDLRPIPGTNGRFDYGMLPKELYEEIRSGILTRRDALRRRVQARD